MISIWIRFAEGGGRGDQHHPRRRRVAIATARNGVAGADHAPAERSFMTPPTTGRKMGNLSPGSVSVQPWFRFTWRARSWCAPRSMILGRAEQSSLRSRGIYCETQTCQRIFSAILHSTFGDDRSAEQGWLLFGEQTRVISR